VRYWKGKKVVGEPRVGVGVASYLGADPRRWASLKCLVASFEAQTYKNWRMLVVHDGPAPHDNEALRNADRLGDWEPRVTFHETAERKQKFGHPHRQFAVDRLAKDCDWLLLTNDDNYYCPVFLEWLLAQATTARGGCLLAYCDMIHSHKLWQPFHTKPKYKHLDLGGFIVHSSLAGAVPFDKHSFAGDGDWINRLAARAGKKVQKVAATLFVHN
jgi:hypothetical protein